MKPEQYQPTEREMLDAEKLMTPRERVLSMRREVLVGDRHLQELKDLYPEGVPLIVLKDALRYDSEKNAWVKKESGQEIGTITSAKDVDSEKWPEKPDHVWFEKVSLVKPSKQYSAKDPYFPEHQSWEPDLAFDPHHLVADMWGTIYAFDGSGKFLASSEVIKEYDEEKQDEIYVRAKFERAEEINRKFGWKPGTAETMYHLDIQLGDLGATSSVSSETHESK